MSIRHLPQDVVDKIKSSVVITSLNGVACGLLANALDAGAFKVYISVDYVRGNCTVEDNGLGILPAEFKEDGGLGKLHHTSRFPTRPTFHGKHGDFLASLASLSLLTITSRYQRQIAHNTLSIHHSQVLSRQLPSPPEQRLVNFDYGTRVSVRNLFGSLPVRVKHRAAMAERTVLDKEWLKLVRDTVALLLAWPSGIAVTLKDSVTQRELRLRSPNDHDVVSRTSRLLTQASLADPSHVGSWIPISAVSGSITVKGCICANPVATRRSQFISLGIQPLTNDYGTDVLYEEINRIFNNSSFGVVEGDENQPQDPDKLDGFTGKELRSRKGIERWPMFYLKIVASNWTETAGIEEKLDSRGKELAAIIDLLKAVCYGFLKKHHFRPQKVRMSSDESVFSTSRTLGRSSRASKRQKISSSGSSRSGSISNSPAPDFLPGRLNSLFDGWDRVKVGKATPMSAASKSMSIRSREQETFRERPLIGEGGKLLRKPFDEPSPEPEDILGASSNASRSVSISRGPSASKLPDKDSAGPVDKETESKQQPKSQPSEWLKRVQQSWVNPVFETAESTVPRINDISTAPVGGHGGQLCCDSAHRGSTPNYTSTKFHGRVSKDALAQATVISQVDRKFILVKLPLNNPEAAEAHKERSSTLIMLDQHAVDERCRLEDLMAEYFTCDRDNGSLKAVIEPLERPLTFEVSSEELELLQKHRAHFVNWGIIYHNAPQKQSAILVKALPPSILERCRLEPRLLIDMLRKEVWRIVDEGQPTRARSSNSQSDKPWITNFHGCPQGILEMLHSRACRSAIMFNDVLTKEDCEQLLSRLARCAFPFQCAHGRPSIAPLVDLGGAGGLGGWQEKKQGQGEKWKRWMEK